jgi:hypothetical protein
MIVKPYKVILGSFDQKPMLRELVIVASFDQRIAQSKNLSLARDASRNLLVANCSRS